MFKSFGDQVKCVNVSADDVLKQAAAYKINLRRLDNDHASDKF